MKELVDVAKFGLRQAWMLRNRNLYTAPAETGSSRLLVDVSAIVPRDAQTGIQRVVRAVWSELVARDGQGFDLVPIFASGKHGYCYASRNFLDREQSREALRPVSVREGDRFLGLDLAAHFLPKYRRQLKAWRNNGASVHIVVYDLLPLQHPQWFEERTVVQFGKWLQVLAEDADQLLCISDQVARDVADHMRQFSVSRQLHIGRLHLGGDIVASVPSRGVCDQLSDVVEKVRKRPAVLMVGTIEPRKAYDVAIEAFDHIWSTSPDEAPDLVIVGKPGWKTQSLQERFRNHALAGKRLHWLSAVSDEGLCRLYDECRGVLVTSRNEGLGLPLIEAAMHGRPALARDLPVFREQELNGIEFFSDDSPHALGQRIMAFAGTEQSFGPRQSNRTWSATVDSLLDELGVRPSSALSPVS